MNLKKHLKYINKLIKSNIIYFKVVLAIITIIYISFILVPKNQSENCAPEWFINYRNVAREIVIFLDYGFVGLVVDSEMINHEADLYYSRAIQDKITLSDHIEVIVTRANGEIELVQ